MFLSETFYVIDIILSRKNHCKCKYMKRENAHLFLKKSRLIYKVIYNNVFLFNENFVPKCFAQNYNNEFTTQKNYYKILINYYKHVNIW